MWDSTRQIEEMRRLMKPTLILTGLVCLCVLTVARASSFPLNPGTYDENNLGRQKEAQKVLKDLNMDLNIDSDAVVRIGEGFTVGPDDVIKGDIVLIGGVRTPRGSA